MRRPARQRLDYLRARQCVCAGTSQRVVFDAARRCSPGSKVNANPIYRTPFIAVHSYALLGPALGLARGGYDDFVQWTRERYLTYTPAQYRPARAGAAPQSRRSPPRLTLPSCWRGGRWRPRAADYAGMTMETRTLLRRDFTYAMRMLRDAMDSLIKISGSSGLMDDNTAQRCWRDVHAISSHVVMNWDVPAENFGRTEFGLQLNPSYPMF